MAVWVGRLNGQNSLLFLFVKALRALLEFCFAKAVHLANFVDDFFLAARSRTVSLTFATLSPSLLGIFFFLERGMLYRFYQTYKIKDPKDQ